MTPAESGARDSYDGMAAYYDRFTAHHDYEAWVATLEALALRHGLRGYRLLDAGCGTGKSFLPFLARGYEVTAFDISPAMARIASDKAATARVLVHDVRALPVLGEFDLVCCLDDGLNHLLSPAELTAALAGLAANLDPDGILLFDLNTRATYTGFFAEALETADDDIVLSWVGHGFEPGSPVASATFTGRSRLDDGAWRASTVVHRQRHHSAGEVHAALRAAGLRALAVYGQGLDGRPEAPVDESHHTKAIYVAGHVR